MKINCECGYKYRILFSPRQRVLTYRINFAVCPKCKTPNNPKFYNTYKNNWKCPICKVFEPWAIKKGKICKTCYFRRYRKRLLKKESEYNSNNEREYSRNRTNRNGS